MEALRVKAEAFALTQRLSAAGALVYLPRGDQDYAIEVGLRMLVLRRIVLEERGLFTANPAEQKILEYYANSISHFLASRRAWVVTRSARTARGGSRPKPVTVQGFVGTGREFVTLPRQEVDVFVPMSVVNCNGQHLWNGDDHELPTSASAAPDRPAGARHRRGLSEPQISEQDADTSATPVAFDQVERLNGSGASLETLLEMNRVQGW